MATVGQFGLGEVSSGVLVQAMVVISALIPIEQSNSNANKHPNVINMKTINNGVINTYNFKCSNDEFVQFMAIFMSEQPDSTGHITVEFDWTLTTEANVSLFTLMSDANERANNPNIVHVLNKQEVDGEDQFTLRSFAKE